MYRLCFFFFSDRLYLRRCATCVDCIGRLFFRDVGRMLWPRGLVVPRLGLLGLVLPRLCGLLWGLLYGGEDYPMTGSSRLFFSLLHDPSPMAH